MDSKVKFSFIINQYPWEQTIWWVKSSKICDVLFSILTRIMNFKKDYQNLITFPK